MLAPERGVRPARRTVEIRMVVPVEDTPSSRAVEERLSSLGADMDIRLVKVRPRSEEALKSLGLHGPVTEPIMMVPTRSGKVLMMSGVEGANQLVALLKGGSKNV